MLLALVLALLVGVTLGLLGGGGSILTVPIFAYVLALEPKTAIASSLFVVGVTSAAGLVSHARAGRVRGRVGAFFGLAGMAGAIAGSRLGRLLPGDVLLAGFAGVMLVTSLAMMRGRRAGGGLRPGQLPIAKIVLLGSAVGLVAGLLGAGGGFLIVPALVFFAGLDMSEAVGTSLLVISLQSMAGFAGNLGHVAIDWTLVLSFTGAAIAGSLVGARLVKHIPAAELRRAFGWFVLVLSLYLFGKQTPPEARAWLADHPSGWLIPAALVAAVVALALRVQQQASRAAAQLPLGATR